MLFLFDLLFIIVFKNSNAFSLVSVSQMMLRQKGFSQWFPEVR